jgi:LAS superfamily LD-carboxypeptidase LdcB
MRVTGHFAGVPQLIDVVEVEPGKFLAHEAAQAFRAMRDDAAQVGIKIHLNSGWRSFERQGELYDRWEEKFEAWCQLPSNTRGDRPPRPAPPGHSKHHTGYAADINRSHDDPDGPGPMQGPTDLYLAERARKFGWYRTIPRELWHWDYTGVIG